MKNSFSQIAALAVFLISCHPAFCREIPAFHPAPAGDAVLETSLSPEHGCPPVTHILVDFLQGGNGFVRWDPVPGIDKYWVRLTDDNNNLLLDTTTTQPHIMISGLIPGENYVISVCYRCPESDELICANRPFRYIIIEDQVVMLESASGCHCKNIAETEGTCSGSEALLFSLSTPRIYNITLSDETRLSMVAKLHVNPVGDCPTDFIEMGMESHGAYDLILPYYQVGNSKIFFHGTTFCIQGASVQSVTYCNSEPSKEKNDADQEPVSNSIFPNPFQDKIMVEIPENGAQLTLFNAVGQKMLETTAATPGVIQLNTAALAPGWYYLHRSGSGGKWLLKG